MLESNRIDIDGNEDAREIGNIILTMKQAHKNVFPGTYRVVNILPSTPITKASGCYR